MALILVALGALLIAAGARGDPNEIGRMFARDLQGDGGYATFALAFVIVGALGFWEPVRPISHGLLLLMVIALVLTAGRNGLVSKAGRQWARIVTPGAESPRAS